MNASDSFVPEEINPPEEQPTPQQMATGQRTLAAIAFTDAVSFSKRMAADEVGTLKLVQRDLHLMQVTCESFEGHVLKSMGDGLLMVFSSAVQAVACSLEIQRSIHQQNLGLPASECLQHRIGIHLGDVLITESDVFGDGVNVASRLQREAEPGGVCLSKTIYEVVANRLPFYTNRIDTRKLKNIGAMKAYQISPVEGGFTSPGGGYSGPTLSQRAQPYLWYLGVAGLAGLFMLIGAGLAIHYVVKHAKHPAKLANKVVTAPQVEPAVTTNTATTEATPSTPVTATVKSELVPVTPVNLTAAPTPTPLENFAQNSPNFFIARPYFMRRYDFAGMCAWIHDHPNAHPNELYLERTCIEFQHLFDWWQNQFQGFTAEQPLVTSSEDGKNFAFYPTLDHKIAVVTETGTTPFQLAQLSHQDVKLIIAALIKTRLDPTSPLAAQIQSEFAKFSKDYSPKSLLPTPAPTAQPQTFLPSPQD